MYLDPEGRFELLGGIIYALSRVPGPPHASTVAFLDYHLSHGLDRAKYLVKSENALEINGIDDTPQRDIAVVTMRADFYATSQPTGADAHLAVEVGDTERNSRAKMRNYMRDGRIRWHGVSTSLTVASRYGRQPTSRTRATFCAVTIGLTSPGSVLLSTRYRRFAPNRRCLFRDNCSATSNQGKSAV